MFDGLRLLVNADDFGMTMAVNRAVSRAFTNGIVRSASLMATGRAFDDAVDRARACPDLGVGIHLVLSGERPVLPPATLPGLVGPDGLLRPLGQVVAATVLHRLPLVEVERELRAQIERVLDAGIRPTHLDTHCHLHAFPTVARIVHALALDYAIPCVRRTELSWKAELRRGPLKRIPIALLLTGAHRLGRRANGQRARTPAGLLGLVRSGSIDESWLLWALERLDPGDPRELMLHPGEEDPDAGLYGDHPPAMRRVELEAATSPAVQRLVARRGVRLMNYRDLATC